MEVERTRDAAAFLAAAAPLLLADEARHNLLLGIAGTVRDAPSIHPDARLWLVRDGGAVVGAALRTPPHNLVLARPARPGVLAALAASLDDEPPGVVGALPEVEELARLWAERTATTPVRRFAQGIYALERVEPARPVAGAMRPAAPDELPLVLDWWRAFAREAGHAEPDEELLSRSLAARLDAPDGGVVLWDLGGPVSLAGYGMPTPNGIRVGPVYTPPELRGRGYASALVGALSAELLARGRRFCFLYTDLANPTANAIYRRLGYALVCESAEIAFS